MRFSFKIACVLGISLALCAIPSLAEGTDAAQDRTVNSAVDSGSADTQSTDSRLVDRGDRARVSADDAAGRGADRGVDRTREGSDDGVTTAGVSDDGKAWCPWWAWWCSSSNDDDSGSSGKSEDSSQKDEDSGSSDSDDDEDPDQSPS